MTKREALESPVNMGPTDEHVYQFPFATAPSAPEVKLYTIAGVDVSTTNLSGSPSVSGLYVIAPKVIDLVPGTEYILICSATVNGQSKSGFLRIQVDPF